MKNFKRPLLAHTIDNIENIKYPVLCSLKLDGIRCIILNGLAVSRTLKPIRNNYVQKMLKGLPDGLDGELCLRDLTAQFNLVSSAIMSEDGKPDFVFVVFDWFMENEPYHNRHWKAECRIFEENNPFVEISHNRSIKNSEEMDKFEQTILERKFEGVMVRSELGQYKQGRSTLKEGILGKLKRFKDAEAEIIGFEEQYTNTNEKTIDNLGLSKRSSENIGMVPANTLGKFLVKDMKGRFQDFTIGSGQGLTHELRKYIWENKNDFIGKIIKYKYQECGTVDKPRTPIFLGFRHKEDM